MASIDETRPGVWRVRVTHGRKPDGSRRTVSVTVHGSKSDAEAEARRLSVAMGASASYGSGLTVGEYVYSVFLSTRSNLKRKTLIGYESDYRLHVAPVFDSVKLEDVTRPMVQAWLSKLPPASARHYFRTLSAIMGGAVDDGCLAEPVNLSRMRFPRRVQPVPVSWGVAEVAECLERLDGSPIMPLWLVMVGAGLSRSEACALEWSDVSTAGPYAVVSVNKALTASDGLGDTKNAYRRRVVPVALPFGARLLELAADGRLWPWSPDHASKFWRRLFSDTLDGLPYVPLNRMRATHETLLQLAGVVDSVNARIHGRSNVQTGYRHYLATGMDAMAGASDALGALFHQD